MVSRARENDNRRWVRSSLGLAVRMLITVGILWYIVRLVPLGEVQTALVNASLPLVCLGLVAQLSLRFVNALRIRIIARAQAAPLSYRAILTTLFTTAFYGLMLPGSVGAGAATLVKYVGHGATLGTALASMIVNRLLDLSTVVAFGMFFWGLENYGTDSAFGRRTGIAFFVLGPVLFIGFHRILFGRTRILERIEGLSKRLGVVAWGAVGRGIANVVSQCAVAGNLSRLDAISVVALSVLKDLLAVVVAYCFALACGVELSFVTIAWMQAVIALLILLPITLSGLGVREGALVLMSGRYGVASPLALSWSLLIFAGTLVISAIGGLIEARTFWRSKR